MTHKIFAGICAVILLLSGFHIGATAASASKVETYTPGELNFSAYTDGAEAAFDGNAKTSYDGSITGMFERKSVIMGITVRAAAPIRDFVIYGSENGVDWIRIYEQKNFRTVAIFGASNINSIPENTCDDLYTYAFRFLRFEMTYGSIAEIDINGYQTAIQGEITEPDKNFAGCGYKTSGSYYDDYDRMPYVISHCLGTAGKGDVITYPDSQNKFAYLTLKAPDGKFLTDIAFSHKTNDKHVTRWNGVAIEASVDGEKWDRIATLSNDFSSLHNFRDHTVLSVSVPESGKYIYARISSTQASISIATMDIYTVADPAEPPKNLFNNWENDPYIGKNAPVETEDPLLTTEEENPDVTQKPGETAKTETEEEKNEQPKKGCGSNMGIPAGLFVMLAAGIFLLTVRRTGKEQAEKNSRA